MITQIRDFKCFNNPLRKVYNSIQNSNLHKIWFKTFDNKMIKEKA